MCGFIEEFSVNLWGVLLLYSRSLMLLFSFYNIRSAADSYPVPAGMFIF